MNNSELSRIELKNQLHFQELNLTMRKSPCKEAVTIDETADCNKPICTATALARHSESIHRMLLLSYVPCGFWSRLITRMLADESVTDVVRSFFNVPPSAAADPVLTKLLNSAQAKWHCWQTGFGLCYLDTFLLRVKEYSLSSSNTTNSTSTFNATSTPVPPTSSTKSYYPYDYQRIKFYLSQQTEQSGKSTGQSQNKDSSIKSNWSEVYIAPQGSALIEIYLPNQTLHVETFAEENNKTETRQRNEYILEPNLEMLTKLLVILVEQIDTLLEDWYPSLGKLMFDFKGAIVYNFTFNFRHSLHSHI